MALEVTDVIAVQKTAGGTGSVRKSTVQALINLATAASGFWSRSGTDLSPATAGDNLTDIGDITATGDLSAAAGTFTGALEAASIDGGEYAV